MKSDNNWYGHRSIFSNYIGQKDKSSFSSIQHGYLNRFVLDRLRLPKIKFIPYLCWNQEVKNRFNNLPSQLSGGRCTVCLFIKKNSIEK